MPDITHVVGSDLMRYGLLRATTYDTKNGLVMVLFLDQRLIYIKMVKMPEIW